MKVGVDGVLIGAWGGSGSPRNILDAGCGCGLIALMMAQRFAEAAVTAVEIDGDSAGEARVNVDGSPWSDRIRVVQDDFIGFCDKCGRTFDLVISNPPFFNAGGDPSESARMMARHCGLFNPSSLLQCARDILATDGQLAMILPLADSKALIEEGQRLGYRLRRSLAVRGLPDAPPKRIMLEFVKDTHGKRSCAIEAGELVLETSPGMPTDEYRTLCRDFYLRF